MSNVERIMEGLKELGLTGEELKESVQIIIQLQKELADSILELKKKNLPSSLAIANQPQAVQLIDMITDNIVEEQGLLHRAMNGEDIYDSLAIIKAKIESLIAGETSQARTISHITQRMKQVKRDETP
ncbi:MAG: hypothetical protein HUU50_07360 [Candidatus Brocadiae bacterium]|nr:hypothetical protein [Candidatus Brocadiia bacterium]